MKSINKFNKINFLIWGLALSSIVSLEVFVLGCTQEDNNMDNATVDSQKANLIALSYLELNNNQYVLKLSEANAISLGISKFDYNRMLTEVQKTNDFIIKSQADGIKVDINDPKCFNINTSNIRLKSDNELYAGSFTLPDDNSQVSFYGTVPSGMSKIQITSTIGCFLGGSTGFVYFAGQSIYYSATGFMGGSTTVTLPYSSGGIVTITGSTYCGNGGIVTITYLRN